MQFMLHNTKMFFPQIKQFAVMSFHLYQKLDIQTGSVVRYGLPQDKI